MRRISAFLLLLTQLCSPLLPQALADVVYLKSGKDLKGLVVEEHRDRILVNTEGKEVFLLRKEIDEVFYDDPERNYLYLGNQALEGGELNLAKEFFRKSLQINSGFQEAEEALHCLEDLQRKEKVSPGQPDPAAALKLQWGLELGRTNPYPTVRVVREGSLAARAGIAAGDSLVSVWGSSLGFLPVEEAARALLGPPATKVKLVLQRDVELSPGLMLGITLGMERLGLTVTAVSQGGAAQGHGINPLDRIVSIQGRSTRYLPLNQARRILEVVKEERVSLRIHRDLMILRE
ncbi:MAG: PDZ domain-containing protein [Candidatus Omnitrophica bacterium]|nr:PDZ domain-containing protein [Candidatus Omnitrophota bacterium]